MDEKFNRIPVSVIHFDKDGTVTDVEDYNLDKVDPALWALEGLLKPPKAASALDFSYFQHASKLVTHHTEKSETVRFRTSFFLFDPLSDPLTVLQLLPTDGVLHIGFHSICTVLFQHQ